MRDTTQAAEEAQRAAIRATAPAQRLRNAFDHSEFVRRLALAGVRRRNPGLTELECAEHMRQERNGDTQSRSAAR